MNKHLKVSLLVISLLLGGAGFAGTAHVGGAYAGTAAVAKFWPSK